jgi:hypothetical protein
MCQARPGNAVLCCNIEPIFRLIFLFLRHSIADSCLLNESPLGIRAMLRRKRYDLVSTGNAENPKFAFCT